ncbi:MAG: hypothetical protein WCI18_16055 [Pseudomonadota bacterium]
MIRFTAIFCLIFLFSSNQGHSESLRPSDISILWPLKSTPSKDGSLDPVFKMKGDGLCNTPKVSDGNLVFKETFDAFQSKVLNKVGDQCERSLELEDKYFLSSDPELMQGDIHLSLLKGIHPFACQEKNWRVTAVRFDPCVNSSLTIGGATKCESELRLVAQLIETSEGGISAVRDFTIHMIYALTPTEIPELVKDLKNISSISKVSEAKTPWEPYFDGKAILRPHHGLRNEMDSCGGTVNTAIKDLLAKYAKPEKLTQMAWMTSSMGVKEWSFGLLEVTEAGKKVELKNVNSQFYDNFSDNLMMSEAPALNKEFMGNKFGSIYDELTIVAGSKIPPSEQSPEKLKSHFSAVLQILNPNKTAQTQPIGCTSCHLAPQTLRRLEDMYGTKAPESEVYKVSIWPGFLAEKRSFTHLRNFGYGPQFNLAINPRTINETDFAVKLLEKEYP